MRLINRGSKQSPLARQACEIALAAHQQRYGDYGRSKMKETYTVRVEGGVSEVLVKFDHDAPKEFAYMAHCHLLEHEDTGMMLGFTV